MSLRTDLEESLQSPVIAEHGVINVDEPAVNLIEISEDDWNLLLSINNGEKVEIDERVKWLEREGLLIIKGDSVSVSQFAASWISA